MAASNVCHSWSPFADNSASFLVTSSFVKAGTVLLVARITVTNTPRGHEKGELVYKKPFYVLLRTLTAS